MPRIARLALAAVLSLHGADDDLESSVSLMSKIGFCGSPTLSPDAKRLIVNCNLSGSPQLWMVPAAGGWPVQLTAFDDPVGGAAWSPAGDWVALSVAPGGGMNTQIYLMRPDGAGVKRITEGGKDNNWLADWTHDGKWLAFSSNRAGAAAMDSYIYDVASGETRLIAKNPGIGAIEDISRDQSRAVINRVRSRGDSDLYLVEIDGGKERLLTPHAPPATFSGGVFSPDGATVYLASNGDRDLTALGRIRLGAGGEPGPIEIIASRDDAELQEFVIDEDGRAAALAWNVAGRTQTSWLDLESLKLTAGPKLPSEIGGFGRFSKDGGLIPIVAGGAAAPNDVWLYDLRAGRLWQVTRSPHAGVDLGALVRPELVRFKALDGLDLSGWLYKPRGFQAPGAVVLSFHGGPEGQERPSFRADYQALLARGIAVFAPNVRGSSGFGKKFVNLDNGELRFDGVRDIKAAAQHIVAAGIGNPKRLGIMGGSYGGYMTMAGLTEFPELFAAGANYFGIVNFETFFQHTEPWMAAISTVEYGDPKTQADLLKRLSPLYKLDRITAPTLVLHGANDTNVPVVEATQVVNTLKGRGVPVAYVLFPDEGHGFRKTPNRIRANVEMVRWFEKHLKR
ncbi:MAG: S9 family peptidase [Bryobacteraceae bacterium]|nr:S9 family peptidase [Bryobacteraceae bacterium]